MQKMGLKNITVLLLLVAICFGGCVHDQFIKNTSVHYYNDLAQRRMLQTTTTGKLRVFMDYSQIAVGGLTQINLVKRMMNISANYFYNLLTVQRLSRLYFPSNTSQQCNILRVPDIYVTQGTVADVGVVVGTQNVVSPNPNQVYMAKSSPCAFLASNKRPIWGVVIWNISSIKYTLQGFQEMLFVGIHQLTHILAFSAMMYSTYPSGNVLFTRPDGSYYLNSPSINTELNRHFGCGNNFGLDLEDQDGTLIASHWQKHHVGNQYMISSNKKQTYVSNFTLALFSSTGWYPTVNFSMGEPLTWGKNKGCGFLNIDDCNFTQFCNDNSFYCDYDTTGIGRCSVDPFTGSCALPKYFTNTICIDQNFQLNNLNSAMQAEERGGYDSRCVSSNYRLAGVAPSGLNYRCYRAVCSTSGAYIYYLVSGYTLVCRTPGQVIPAIPGFEGTLNCPTDFLPICGSKKTCPFNCNQNGMCINGQCLCYNSIVMTTTCTQRTPTSDPVVTSGGRTLFAINDNPYLPERLKKKYLRKQYSFSDKCKDGFTYDPITQKCESCLELLGCSKCNQKGCIQQQNTTLQKVQ